MRRKLALATTVACASAMLLSGCSSSTTSSGADASGSSVSGIAASFSPPAPQQTSYPLTIDNCGYKQTFTKPPSRVVILNGASVGEVESFIELGLQKTIYGNAQHYGVSDEPGMVEKINAIPTAGLTSNDNFDVPAEQLLAAKPDLVVSTWSGGFAAKSGFATRERLAAAGINTFVNPVNCAYGKENPTHAEQEAYQHRSMSDSLNFLTDLGRIFDIQQRATTLAIQKYDAIRHISSSVAGKSAPKVLIAFPGMSAMNSNGLPAVFSGGIYDDILRAAGAENSFPNTGEDLTSTLSKERLAAAGVDLLVVGRFTPNEDADAEAKALFAAYPQWQAAKNKRWITLSDSVYFGPLNQIAVRDIAKAAHPGSGA